MACRVRGPARYPRAFPVALGMPIAVTVATPCLWKTLHRCHPVGRPGAQPLLAGMWRRPCRNRRSGRPRPAGGGCHRPLPYCLEPLRAAMCLLTLLATTCWLRLFSNRQPLLAGLRRLGLGLAGSGAPLRRLSLRR